LLPETLLEEPVLMNLEDSAYVAHIYDYDYQQLFHQSGL
jgi:hypothetical protein